MHRVLKYICGGGGIMCWRVVRLLFLVLVLSAGGATEGADYYVSSSGSDDNAGTSPDEAWRSIEKVNGMSLAPGDRILFEGGQTFGGSLYFGSGGTAEKPIVVGSYGESRATISSGDEKGFCALDCGGFEIKDLIFVGSKNGELERWEHHGIHLEHSDGGEHEEHVYIDNVDVSNYIFGIKIGCRAENNVGYKDIRITNTEVHDNWDKAIFIHGYFPRPEGRWANRDVYIADCVVHGNSGSESRAELLGNGIELENVQGGLVEFCLSYGNGLLCYNKNNGPIGIWTWESDKVAIRFCEAHHNDAERVNGCGYGVGGGASNCVVEYSYTSYNTGAGFLIWSEGGGFHKTIDNVVRYNISENDGLKNGAGAVTFSSYEGILNTDVYNNVLYTGVWSTGACVVVYTDKINDTSFHNNIFMTAADKKVVMFYSTSGRWSFQGNCYWSSGGPLEIIWGGSKYGSVEVWRAATGQEMLEGIAVGFEADPQLLSAGGGGTVDDPHKLDTLAAYKLEVSSPLIDRGLNLGELFGINCGGRDFYGTAVPRGGGFDVGTHEYAEGGSDRAGTLSSQARTSSHGLLLQISAGLAVAGTGAFLVFRMIRRGKNLLVGESTGGQTGEASHENRLVSAIKLFIAENFTEMELSRETIAEYFNLSAQYTGRLFKKETGVNLVDYINEMRVERAKELLKDARLHISEVAFAAGFNTLQTFNRTFKKMTHQTPSAYRESL